MARSDQTRAMFAAWACMLVLSAGCTDDFSRFKFGKKVVSPRDAGTQNVSIRAGNSAQSLVDASTTAESNMQQRTGAGNAGRAGTGQPQARGTRSGFPGGNSADPQDLADRDD